MRIFSPEVSTVALPPHQRGESPEDLVNAPRRAIVDLQSRVRRSHRFSRLRSTQGARIRCRRRRIGCDLRDRERVLTAFSSGWTTAVGAVADVSGDVYRARLGDFRRPRIGASAGAALSERAPAAVQAAVDAKRGRRSCVVPRRVLHEVPRSR